MEKKIIAIICAIIGFIGCIASAIIISNDMTGGSMFSMRYTYKPPFTAHETTMLIIAGISVIMLIAGIISYVVISHKNKP